MKFFLKHQFIFQEYRDWYKFYLLKCVKFNFTNNIKWQIFGTMLNKCATLHAEQLLGNHEVSSWPTLTAEQVRARKVLNSELPELNSDPAEWQRFIACFVESTNRCGLIEMENLNILARCLKGSGLSAFKFELSNYTLLSNV